MSARGLTSIQFDAPPRYSSLHAAGTRALVCGQACYEMDFRQNMCLYDLTNDVIIDKTGSGVQDIRDRVLRLSCAAGESYEAWAAATITQGFKEVRACVNPPPNSVVLLLVCAAARASAALRSRVSDAS
eukprot:6696143-Prymnesium_polylepis.1